MIETYMKRICRDDAVYWASPEPTSSGYMTYSDPREIKCRWISATEMIVLRTGREVTSLATIWVLEDLDEGGMLFHGKLDDLSADQKADPRKVPNAFEIRIPWKTPSLAMQDEYVRKIALTK